MTNRFGRYGFALAAVGAGLAAAAASGTDSAEAGGGLTCEIRASKSGSGVELTGVVRASQATSGSYRFSVAQSGSGGSSDIDQGGDFSLKAGEQQVVGEISLGKGSFDARLKVSSSAGGTSCARHTSL